MLLAQVLALAVTVKVHQAVETQATELVKVQAAAAEAAAQVEHYLATAAMAHQAQYSYFASN
jgi:hypothetical protein